jgi:hypothetical protein
LQQLEAKVMPSVIDAAQNCAGAAGCLEGAGVRVVIRYYTEFTQMPQKRLTPAEAGALAAAGFELGAVYQDAHNAARHFSRSLGLARGRYAYRYAQDTIAQPPGSAINFAVDFDAAAAEIDAGVVPYFEGLGRAFDDAGGGAPDYRIGVYGSGLVCRRVLDQGLAAVAWLAAARGWRETRAFDESGRWHLKQNPESTLCGLQVDVDDTNPAQPDFGAFRHDLAGPVPAGSRHRVTARSGLRLRAGPSTGFDVIAILALGTEIDVLERAGEWAKVDLEGDGLADAFVHAGFLEPLD